jgi:hypothetical protein
MDIVASIATDGSPKNLFLNIKRRLLSLIALDIQGS